MELMDLLVAIIVLGVCLGVGVMCYDLATSDDPQPWKDGESS